jgi:hypothetical protein
MRGPLPKRSTLALVAAIVLIFGGVSPTGLKVIGPPHALGAECLGLHIYKWVYGGRSTAAATGIKGNINYVNGTACLLPPVDGFTAESVTICRNGSCGGWVQVGFIKRGLYTAPKLYCEFAPNGPGRFIDEFSLGAGIHLYEARVTVSGGDNVWGCFRDGVLKSAATTLYMGFSSGTWQLVQGETDSIWSTIGKVDPNRLLYKNLKYLQGGTWQVLDINESPTPDPHYGRDEPEPGEFRDWTW